MKKLITLIIALCLSFNAFAETPILKLNPYPYIYESTPFAIIDAVRAMTENYDNGGALVVARNESCTSAQFKAEFNLFISPGHASSYTKKRETADRIIFDRLESTGASIRRQIQLFKNEKLYYQTHGGTNNEFQRNAERFLANEAYYSDQASMTAHMAAYGVTRQCVDWVGIVSRDQTSQSTTDFSWQAGTNSSIYQMALNYPSANSTGGPPVAVVDNTSITNPVSGFSQLNDPSYVDQGINVYGGTAVNNANLVANNLQYSIIPHAANMVDTAINACQPYCTHITPISFGGTDPSNPDFQGVGNPLNGDEAWGPAAGFRLAIDSLMADNESSSSPFKGAISYSYGRALGNYQEVANRMSEAFSKGIATFQPVSNVHGSNSPVSFWGPIDRNAFQQDGLFTSQWLVKDANGNYTIPYGNWGYDKLTGEQFSGMYAFPLPDGQWKGTCATSSNCNAGDQWSPGNSFTSPILMEGFVKLSKAFPWADIKQLNNAVCKKSAKVAKRTDVPAGYYYNNQTDRGDWSFKYPDPEKAIKCGIPDFKKAADYLALAQSDSVLVDQQQLSAHGNSLDNTIAYEHGLYEANPGRIFYTLVDQPIYDYYGNLAMTIHWVYFWRLPFNF